MSLRTASRPGSQRVGYGTLLGTFTPAHRFEPLRPGIGRDPALRICDGSRHAIKQSRARCPPKAMLKAWGASRDNRRRMDVKTLLALVVSLALCGCRTAPRAAASDSPMELNNGFRREYHDAFSSGDRTGIAAARRGIRKSGKMPRDGSDDAYYRVRHTPEGDRVFVIYVTGYEGSQPQFTPCVHNEVFLRKDGSVLKVLIGPECWPSP